MARGGERELIRMGAGGGAEALFFFVCVWFCDALAEGGLVVCVC